MLEDDDVAADVRVDRAVDHAQVLPVEQVEHLQERLDGGAAAGVEEAGDPQVDLQELRLLQRSLERR